MGTFVIDRSTDVQSLAYFEEGGAVESAVLDGLDSRSGEWTARVDKFLLGRRPSRFIVGTGPGSFAGIRAALAFAQGWAIGAGCAVVGLTSAAALASEGRRTAVVGDARRGLLWVALFDGFTLLRDVFQVKASDLRGAVPSEFAVTTPDERRIGDLLKETFGTAYAGGGVPTAERLAEAARRNPSLLKPEPLPIYLNPAVRED